MKRNLLKFCACTLTSICVLFAVNTANAQVGIGTKTPDVSAMLDVTSVDKGLLIPRVTLQNINDAATIPNPATSLLVFNTTNNIAGPGYYYNSGTKVAPVWAKLTSTADPATGWLITGNDNINDAVNFMGTKGDADVVLRRQIVEGIRIRKGGSVLFTGDQVTGGVPVSGAGARLMWVPNKQAFRAGVVDGAQWDVVGAGSFAAGINPIATAANTIALGRDVSATAIYGVAIGNDAKATESRAISIGTNTTASGDGALAMGNTSLASGSAATALGFSTEADGAVATAMGQNTRANGEASTAMGQFTTATGIASVAMGQSTVAIGNASMALGNFSIASGPKSVALGNHTEAIGDNSLATGSNTKAEIANSTAMGNGTHANGQSAVAMGSLTTASNDNTTAMGLSTIASGKAATAIGEFTTASGVNSTSMGFQTTASGDRSTAMGSSTKATALNATAMGSSTQATALNATATGLNTVAGGNNSFAMGEGTFTQANGSLVVGRFNKVVNQDPVAIAETDRIFVVGNGLDAFDLNRNNAFTVERSGRTGINTESPQALLTLKGKTFGGDIWRKHIRLVDEASTGFSAMIYDSEGTKFRNFRANNEFTFRDINDVVLARLKANGELIIKGDLTANGIVNPSDIRLKENISSLTNVLGKINTIQPISYNFKDKKAYSADHQIGFSAQEIEKTFPELVKKNEKGFLAVNYAQMSAVAIEAIKEQQEIINDLKNKIGDQQKDINELKNIIQSLNDHVNKLGKK